MTSARLGIARRARLFGRHAFDSVPWLTETVYLHRQSSGERARVFPRGAAAVQARVVLQRRRLFVAGGILFASYYLGFWIAGVYTTQSLVAGIVMALGLVAVGVATPRPSSVASRAAAVGVAILLAVGACTSAAFSGGSHCIGFHTLWALPLIYGLFVNDDWVGSATIAALSLLGGVGLLLHDGEGTTRILQWLTLSISAGVFAFVQQMLARNNAVETVREAEQAQASAALADRMASIGMLAAGVAHEINNPISYVGTNVQYVSDRLRDADVEVTPAAARELNAALGDALAGCERVTAIVQTLSRLSRDKGTASARTDVNRALTDVIRLSRRDLEHRATLHFVPGDLKPIPGDEARLGQVFLNLLINAAHAVEERPEGPRTIDVRSFARTPGQIIVEVTDSGCGIAAERISRVFDPFFTTKPPGIGTGLGLALCAEIVAQHCGTIEVESTQGQGSVFRVVLPAVGEGRQ